MFERSLADLVLGVVSVRQYRISSFVGQQHIFLGVISRVGINPTSTCSYLHYHVGAGTSARPVDVLESSRSVEPFTPARKTRANWFAYFYSV